MEENTRKGRSSRMRKEVVGYVQAVLGNNKFLVQLEDGHNKEMSSCSLFLMSKTGG